MPDVSQPRSRVPLGEEFASPCSLYPSGREQDRDHLSAGLLAGPGCVPRVKSRVQDFASNACRPRAEISEIRGGTEGPRRSSSPHGCHLSATGVLLSLRRTHSRQNASQHSGIQFTSPRRCAPLDFIGRARVCSPTRCTWRRVPVSLLLRAGTAPPTAWEGLVPRSRMPANVLCDPFDLGHDGVFTA